MNCDGELNLLDVDMFVLALIDPMAYQTVLSCYPISKGDMNSDTKVDGGDVAPFSDALTP